MCSVGVLAQKQHEEWTWSGSAHEWGWSPKYSNTVGEGKPGLSAPTDPHRRRRINRPIADGRLPKCLASGASL
jgi:hypothetical protein